MFKYKKLDNKLYIYDEDKPNQWFDYKDFNEEEKAIIQRGIKNSEHIKKLYDIF